MGPKNLGQIRYVPAIYLKMKLIGAPKAGVQYPALESSS
jgi:hypothetical protein